MFNFSTLIAEFRAAIPKADDAPATVQAVKPVQAAICRSAATQRQVKSDT